MRKLIAAASVLVALAVTSAPAYANGADVAEDTVEATVFVRLHTTAEAYCYRVARRTYSCNWETDYQGYDHGYEGSALVRRGHVRITRQHRLW